MFGRRTFLASAAGAAISAKIAAPGNAAVAGATGGSADVALQRLLDRHVEAYLWRSPEAATANDRDTGARAALRGALDDRSLAARGTDRAAIRQARRALAAVPRAALSPRARLDYDVADFVYVTLDDLLGRYGYVDGELRPSPYVVSQMNGAYYWLPDFIGTRHPIAAPADVDAWLARLAALSLALDQETDRIAHDAALGVVPPDFIIARTIGQIKALRDTDPSSSSLIAPALKRIALIQHRDVGPDAARIFRERIAPALDRQIAALAALAPSAVAIGGVWRLPDGDSYYAAAVRSNTTVAIAPADLHRQGLAMCAEITAALDGALVAQGLAGGSVAQRLAALDADPRFHVTNDDAGRARVIAQARAAIDLATERLPRAFGAIRIEPLEVRRTPQAIETGAPGAYYSQGAPGQPGLFSLNLRNPAEQNSWRLPTLAHHEGVPGHHLQYCVLNQAGELSLFRRIASFSAYTEGWALYAQRVADEIGVFEDDPFGRIGYLQSQLFRAARIVVDTGLHHERWSVAQAVDWMVENGGEQREATEREVARYAVYPGQACSFKVGEQVIFAAREAARKAMGPAFDVAKFHDLVLKSGPAPMPVLEQAVSQWSHGEN